MPFVNPRGVAAAPDRSIYVTDGHCIKKIYTDGEVRMIAGLDEDDIGDGEGERAGFYAPTDIIIAPDGSQRVSDSGNDRICQLEIKD